MKDYSIAQARDRLPALVHEAERQGPVRLTRRGRPVAVIVSAEDYERFSPRRGSLFRELQKFRKKHALDGGATAALETVRDRSRGRPAPW